MHNNFGLVAGENTVQPRSISNVTDFERSPLYGLLMAINEAVDNDRLMACIVERFTGMASNIARSTNNQYTHNNRPLEVLKPCFGEFYRTIVLLTSHWWL